MADCFGKESESYRLFAQFEPVDDWLKCAFNTGEERQSSGITEKTKRAAVEYSVSSSFHLLILNINNYH